MFLITVTWPAFKAAAQTSDVPYFQQQANFSIQVTLNDLSNTLDGSEKIEYINNSPDTLKFIWFHVWPNAYRNDQTAFSDQLLENGNVQFYFSNPDEKGYINRLDFKVNGVTAETQDHPTHIDIIKLLLPTPLIPRGKATITTPFHVKLPFNLSRGGHDGQTYQATQWYPKPAVYDRDGWHPMTYLDQGEFYSEFGSYDVSITVPSNYVVAATGIMDRDDEETNFLASRANFTWQPIITHTKTKGGQVKRTTQLYPASSATLKTLRFRQDHIHDFAWFADKRFIVQQDTCRLASGKIIDVNIYYTPAHKDTWSRVIDYAKKGIAYYSYRIGDYPYANVSVVQGPESFGSGMEYPTITSIAPMENTEDLELTTVHEIGHNWFYGALGSNERDFPWMDEGFNTYYEQGFGASDGLSASKADKVALDEKMAEKLDQPINTPSEKMSVVNYEIVTYYKTSMWLRLIEQELGRPVFDQAMNDYYKNWQFKHPQPADFKRSLEQSSGKNLDSAFAYIDHKGPLPNQVKPRGLTSIPGLSGEARNPPIYSPTKEALLVTPALGINNYDKLMLGAMFTNFIRPAGGLQYLLAPMYGFSSKKFSGTGLVSYSAFPKGFFQRFDIGITGAIFSTNKIKDDDGNATFLRVRKGVPGFKLIQRQRDPRSTVTNFLTFKTYLFGEDQLGFRRDTITDGVDTVVKNRFSAVNKFRYLNQLRLVTENKRALYPYRAELKVEQGKEFMRAGFTGNYFFNYASDGRKGASHTPRGLDVRVFAGKFFYLQPRNFNTQFATDRYHLTMSGPNGSEDYTYTDYYAGRSEFQGILSQQMSQRDGAFKVRTDLLSEKVGKTDDWLASLNLRSTLPKGINPLALLPIEIPIRVFADIGTYAEAWERNTNLDHFLYDAGFEVSLVRETVHIYIPLFYSKIYKSYFKSLPEENTFGKRISFSIDLINFNPRRWDPNATY